MQVASLLSGLIFASLFSARKVFLLESGLINFRIYIKEKILNDSSIAIWIDGILDTESMPVLENICNRYLKEGKKSCCSWRGLSMLAGKEKVS
jgi:hypothetical protein